MVEITTIELGVPGPAGVGITASEKNALAPKASPTFTGTVTADDLNVGDDLNVTGDLAVTGTLAVTGAATFTGNVTLGNSTSDDITMTGHIKTTGSAPSSVVGVAAGSTGSSAVQFGNDTRGCVRVTAGGTGITTGVMTTLTFTRARADTNYTVHLSAGDADAATLQLWVSDASKSTSAFGIRTNTALTTAVAYDIYYWVID